MSTLDPGVTGRRRSVAGHRSRRKKPKKSKKQKKTLLPPPGSPFMTIQQAGKEFFGLSKNGSYDAAERGDFGKLYVVGRRKFVVVKAIEAKIKARSEMSEAAE